MLTLPPTDLAILTAQLAFIRVERAAQWEAPRAFHTVAGRKTPRQQRLTELTDDVGDALLALVRAHPDIQRLTARRQLVAVRTVEHVAERCGRFGFGVSGDDIACIEACIRRQLAESGTDGVDAMWSALGTRLLVPADPAAAGPLLYWPAALPAELFAPQVTALTNAPEDCPRG